MFGAQKNRLNEMVLWSTHNLGFGREIRKLIFNYTLYLEACNINCDENNNLQDYNQFLMLSQLTLVTLWLSFIGLDQIHTHYFNSNLIWCTVSRLVDEIVSMNAS